MTSNATVKKVLKTYGKRSFRRSSIPPSLSPPPSTSTLIQQDQDSSDSDTETSKAIKNILLKDSSSSLKGKRKAEESTDGGGELGGAGRTKTASFIASRMAGATKKRSLAGNGISRVADERGEVEWDEEAAMKEVDSGGVTSKRRKMKEVASPPAPPARKSPSSSGKSKIMLVDEVRDASSPSISPPRRATLPSPSPPTTSSPPLKRSSKTTPPSPLPPPTISFESPPTLLLRKSPPKRTLSPAKDLSGVFESFSALGDGKSKSLVPPVASTSTSMVGNLGARNSAPQSPLHRSLSQPQQSPSRSRASTPLGLTSSLPILSPSPTRTLARTNSLSLGLVAPPPLPSNPSSLNPGVRKTYGENRSFKEEEPQESPKPSSSSSSPFSVKLPRPPPKERQTYSSLRQLWGVDVEEELEGEENGNETKSVNILRARGENKKWVDEFEYLLEGLGVGGGIGLRRSSAIEILKKLTEDKEFGRRLKAAGFVERVYESFRKAGAGDGDKVLDLALTFLTAFLLRDQRAAEPLLSSSLDIFKVLGKLLMKVWGDDPKGKDEVRSMKVLLEVINNSDLTVGVDTPPTLKSLSTLSLSLISSLPPRPNFAPQQMLYDSGSLENVFVLLEREADELGKRVERFRAGLDFIPDDGSVNLEIVSSLLLTIESCLTAAPISTSPLLSTHLSKLSSAFSSLLLSSHIIASSPSPIKEATFAAGILMSTLRLLIELTTVEGNWSGVLGGDKEMIRTLVRVIVASRNQGGEGKIEEIVAPEEVGRSSSLGVEEDEEDRERKRREKEEEAKEGRFDILCLALGILTNLIESVGEAKDLLREIRLAPDCKEYRKCCRECFCSNKVTAIFRITELYIDPLNDSSSELDTTFITGYTGILLGLIMLGSPPNQDLVVRALGHHEEPMDRLLEAMEEFAKLHEGELAEEGEGEREVAGALRELVEGVRARLGRG